MMNAPASEIRSAQQRRAVEGVYSEFPTPGLFDGGLDATTSGLYAGGVGMTISAVDPFLADAEEEGGLTGFAAGLTRKALIDEYDRTRPDPKKTGKAAQLLYGVMSVIPQAAEFTAMFGPLGGASAVGYMQGYTDYRLARKEGLDEATARKRGAITGLTMAAGVAAPASLGVTLPAKIASGAGINVALGGVQRGATSKVLEDAGYPEMADQYKVFDGWGMAADAILGGTLGGIYSARYKETKITWDQKGAVDAGLILNDAFQFEGSSFGIPADGKTRTAHSRAMDQASKQVLNGEPVNIAEHFIPEMTFVPKPPDVEVSRAYDEAYKELGLSDLLDEARAQEESAANLRRELPESPRAFDPEKDSVVIPEGTVLPPGLKTTMRFDGDNTSTLPEAPVKPERAEFKSDEDFNKANDIYEQTVSERDGLKKFLTDLNEKNKAEKPKDVVSQILQEKPDIEISKGVKAEDAVKAVDEEVSRAKESPKLFDAAISCFLRRG